MEEMNRYEVGKNEAKQMLKGTKTNRRDGMTREKKGREEMFSSSYSSISMFPFAATEDAVLIPCSSGCPCTCPWPVPFTPNNPLSDVTPGESGLGLIFGRGRAGTAYSDNDDGLGAQLFRWKLFFFRTLSL